MKKYKSERLFKLSRGGRKLSFETYYRVKEERESSDHDRLLDEDWGCSRSNGQSERR